MTTDSDKGPAFWETKDIDWSQEDFNWRKSDYLLLPTQCVISATAVVAFGKQIGYRPASYLEGYFYSTMCPWQEHLYAGHLVALGTSVHYQNRSYVPVFTQDYEEGALVIPAKVSVTGRSGELYDWRYVFLFVIDEGLRKI